MITVIEQLYEEHLVRNLGGHLVRVPLIILFCKYAEYIGNSLEFGLVYQHPNSLSFFSKSHGHHCCAGLIVRTKSFDPSIGNP